MAEQASTLPQTQSVTKHKGSTARRILGPDWKIAIPFLLPIVILMTLFIAWPFIDAAYTSMTIRTMNREVKFVGLDNYIRLFQDRYYWQSVRATFVFTAGAIFFKLIFGLIAALLLNSLNRGRNLLTGLVLLPWIIPPVVQALAWRSILDPLFGGLNPILLGLGILDRPASWLADPDLAMASVIAVNVWAGIPFFTVNMLAGMAAIDSELYEAAAIDGANAWEKFRNITLPGLRFVIAVATLLSTIWTFNNFETIFLLTQGGPGNITKVYSILAYEKAMRALQFGPGTAVAFSLVPVLLFFIMLLSRFMRRDAGSGDEITTWQDRFIDGIGKMITAIFSLIALPFQLIGRAWSALFPSSGNSPSSIKRQRQLATIGRNIGLALLLSFILFPFYWIHYHCIQERSSDRSTHRHLLAQSLDARAI